MLQDVICCSNYMIVLREVSVVVILKYLKHVTLQPFSFSASLQFQWTHALYEVIVIWCCNSYHLFDMSNSKNTISTTSCFIILSPQPLLHPFYNYSTWQILIECLSLSQDSIFFSLSLIVCQIRVVTKLWHKMVWSQIFFHQRARKIKHKGCIFNLLCITFIIL